MIMGTGAYGKGCSPRTRGWTPVPEPLIVPAALLPAHAGMDPRADQRRRHPRPAPRARGDGPPEHIARQIQVYCSPRTRGWTLPTGTRSTCPRLLPAHAGMDPFSSRPETLRRTAPRARGDGPGVGVVAVWWLVCFPRTRGWTPLMPKKSDRRVLLPAHAGMVPSPGRIRPVPRPAPRARGDGPMPHSWHVRRSNCSLRPQGWTPRRAAGWPAAGSCSPRPRGWTPPGWLWCRGDSAPRARGDGDPAHRYLR
jgi:hypothetical protein